MNCIKAWILGFSVLAVVSCKGRPAAEKTERPNAAPGTFTPAEEVPFIPAPRARDPNKKYFGEGTPTRAIQDLDDKLETYILNPKTPAQVRYNEDLKKNVLRGTFEIGELCRLALAQHWKERSERDQRHFVDLMTRLLERKAIFSKEQGGKKSKGTLYTIKYQGDRFLDPGQELALVRTLVDIPSEALQIELNYRLRHVGDIWKIYDVIVDGASLLDNYRFQFDKIIKKDGYAILVHRMESKLKELESLSL